MHQRQGQNQQSHWARQEPAPGFLSSLATVAWKSPRLALGVAFGASWDGTFQLIFSAFPGTLELVEHFSVVHCICEVHTQILPETLAWCQRTHLQILPGLDFGLG